MPSEDKERSSRPVWLGEDGRGWDHVRVHVALIRDPRLDAYCMAAYMGLVAHAELQTGETRPGLELLAEYTQTSEQTMRRATRRLEAAGYIAWLDRPGKARVYRLLPPPQLVHTPAPGEGVFSTTPATQAADPCPSGSRTRTLDKRKNHGQGPPVDKTGDMTQATAAARDAMIARDRRAREAREDGTACRACDGDGMVEGPDRRMRRCPLCTSRAAG